MKKDFYEEIDNFAKPKKRSKADSSPFYIEIEDEDGTMAEEATENFDGEFSTVEVNDILEEADELSFDDLNDNDTVYDGHEPLSLKTDTSLEVEKILADSQKIDKDARLLYNDKYKKDEVIDSDPLIEEILAGGGAVGDAIKDLDFNIPVTKKFNETMLNVSGAEKNKKVENEKSDFDKSGSSSNKTVSPFNSPEKIRSAPDYNVDGFGGVYQDPYVYDKHSVDGVKVENITEKGEFKSESPFNKSESIKSSRVVNNSSFEREGGNKLNEEDSLYQVALDYVLGGASEEKFKDAYLKQLEKDNLKETADTFIDTAKGSSQDYKEGKADNFKEGDSEDYREERSGNYSDGSSKDYREGKTGSYTEGSSKGFREEKTDNFTEGSSKDLREGKADTFKEGNSKDYREERSGNYSEGNSKEYRENRNVKETDRYTDADKEFFERVYDYGDKSKEISEERAKDRYVARDERVNDSFTSAVMVNDTAKVIDKPLNIDDKFDKPTDSRLDKTLLDNDKNYKVVKDGFISDDGTKGEKPILDSDKKPSYEADDNSKSDTTVGYDDIVIETDKPDYASILGGALATGMPLKNGSVIKYGRTEEESEEEKYLPKEVLDDYALSLNKEKINSDMKEAIKGVNVENDKPSAKGGKNNVVRLLIDDGTIICDVCGHLNKKHSGVCEMCSNYLTDRRK